MNPVIANKEIAVRGKLFRTARLRHEWCDFFEDPLVAIEQFKNGARVADVLTFVPEVYGARPAYPFQKETASVAVLTFANFKTWWDNMGFKARNKTRKAQKAGVELRMDALTDDFAKGVEGIYNESPTRQGRRFFHYGKKAPAIKEELTSFIERCYLVGAYFNGELIGFMKLFQGENILRTVHIVAKLSYRDKCVMDALIAKAVELCDEKAVQHLQYGSWTDGGVGTFRIKHGFQKVDVPRYFVPLTGWGALMLRLNMHLPLRERLPQSLVEALKNLRSRWNHFRLQPGKELANV